LETTFDTSTFETAKAFFDSQLPGLTERMCLCQAKRARFTALFLAALAESSKTICQCRNAGVVPPTATGRALLDFLGETAVGKDSQLLGAEHVASALNFMRRGGNVLMVQNHSSGADTVAWDRLVNLHFDNAAREFGYMAGHVVTLFLLPLTVTSGMRRFQIFSTKYKALAEQVGMCAADMQDQNVRAIEALTDFAKPGGVCVGLYPEGGRGETGLKEGEPTTVAIGEVMAANSPHGLIVLPTYVSGTTNILPVVRTPDEFERFLCHLRTGNASVTCGKPLLWCGISPRPEKLYGRPFERREERDERRRKAHAITMRAIASLAPAEARGFWS
jgi:1-acyl-sn-glycerol-3-phosphate acyltransferase